MSNVVRMQLPEEEPENLTEAMARAKARSLAAVSENVALTAHVRQRMKERDVTTAHVSNCLNKGSVSEPPHKNIYGNWQFNLSCRTAGIEIELGVAIDWPDDLIVLTVLKRRG